MKEGLIEAAAVNKSLSALSDVLKALRECSPFVPYRNSKLTQLLKVCEAARVKHVCLLLSKVHSISRS